MTTSYEFLTDPANIKSSHSCVAGGDNFDLKMIWIRDCPE